LAAQAAQAKMALPSASFALMKKVSYWILKNSPSNASPAKTCLSSRPCKARKPCPWLWAGKCFGAVQASRLAVKKWLLQVKPRAAK
jgi:hypothetical protein